MDRIVLRGDDQDFDNIHYVVPREPQSVKLLYIGEDAADDVQGMQYYLRLAVAGDPLRHVEVLELKAGVADSMLAGEAIPLVVATCALDEATTTALHGHVARGGTLVLVPRNSEAAERSVGRLSGEFEFHPQHGTPYGVVRRFLQLAAVAFAIGADVPPAAAGCTTSPDTPARRGEPGADPGMDDMAAGQPYRHAFSIGAASAAHSQARARVRIVDGGGRTHAHLALHGAGMVGPLWLTIFSIARP